MFGDPLKESSFSAVRKNEYKKKKKKKKKKKSPKLNKPPPVKEEQLHLHWAFFGVEGSQ